MCFLFEKKKWLAVCSSHCKKFLGLVNPRLIATREIFNDAVSDMNFEFSFDVRYLVYIHGCTYLGSIMA